MQFITFHFTVSNIGKGPRAQSVNLLLVFDIQMRRLLKQVKCKNSEFQWYPVENTQKLPGSCDCLMTVTLSSRGDVLEKYSQFAKQCHYS